MQYGALSDHFAGVVAKRLSAVEADTDRSNQHEFNGVAALQGLLGDQRRERQAARFVWLGDDAAALTDDARATWYDARESHPTRSEWRLYFTANAVMAKAVEGDMIVVTRRSGGELLFLVVARGGGLETAITWLFGLGGDLGPTFRYGETDRSLDFVSRLILEEIGIEPEPPRAEKFDHLVEQFGLRFPSTRTMSDLARGAADAPDCRDDPDAALLGWVETEEALFRSLERRIVAERLERGFFADGSADVDDFLGFSLSVQNRRKSRMGLSLENHAEAVLTAYGLRHSRGALTEGSSRPDFLFPSAAAYADPAFPSERLAMLGVKSTLKDRWRQVLAEAARIRPKHLLTLAPGVSAPQAEEMARNALVLVAPRPLLDRLGLAGGAGLIDLAAFLSDAARRQAPCAASG